MRPLLLTICLGICVADRPVEGLEVDLRATTVPIAQWHAVVDDVLARPSTGGTVVGGFRYEPDPASAYVLCVYMDRAEFGPEQVLVIHDV